MDLRFFRVLRYLSLLSPFFLKVAGAGPVTLEIAASRGEIKACEGGEVEIALQIRNPDRAEVAGFQAFLRFPAALFKPVEYRKRDLKGLEVHNGPPAFGSGFAGCDAALQDPWDDGLGFDVVSVSATAHAEGAGGEPVTAASATLGAFVFEMLLGSAAQVESAPFSLEFESCSTVLQQGTALYDAAGAALEVAFLNTEARVKINQGIRVRDLACSPDVKNGAVRLSWASPSGVHFDGINVYRSGSLIRALVLPSVHEVIDASPPSGALLYEVVVIAQGREESCRSSCTVEFASDEQLFVRGDANFDGAVNISDAVAVLDYLFSGIPSGCADALDADDTGVLDLSDVVTILGHLFQGGPVLRPPFPERGRDPTEDPLGCRDASH